MKRVLLLSLVFVATLVAMAATLEVGARAIYPEQLDNRCADPADVTSFRPNCSTQPMKIWEGPWFTYVYNDCGYRSDGSCRANRNGLIRVAVVGTSMAKGMFVPYRDTFSARAEATLKADCKAPVDFENLSLPAAAVVTRPQWHRILERFPAALALRPAALVTVVSSLDLSYYNNAPAGLVTGYKDNGPLAAVREQVEQVKKQIGTSRAVMAMRRVMFRNGDIYLQHFLQKGDSADYLHEPLSPAWQMRLDIAKSVLARAAQQTQAAGVPLIVVYYPTYAQAVAAQSKDIPGLAPYAFARQLQAVIEANGGHFMDLTPLVAAQPDVASLYYVSNDHPNGEGHRLMAANLVKALLADAPAFKSCRGAS